jgi:hypothetical protein
MIPASMRAGAEPSPTLSQSEESTPFRSDLDFTDRLHEQGSDHR